MRSCFAFVVAALLSLAGARAEPARAASADEAMLLFEALEKTARDLRRWAYTETRLIRDEKGRVKTNLVLRHDPSKPYPEQWTPIAVNGQPPTKKDFDKYRRQGERAGQREEEIERGRRTETRKTLGEVIDPRAAKIVSDDGRRLVFEIPLRKEGNDRFPPEKFEVLARIDREQRALEHIAVRLRDSFRSKLVLKVKSGGGTMEFAAVDPKHAPTLTAIRGDASASILFVSVGGKLELTRTDLKRVKPYNERFDVQIGTIKALDF